MVYNVYRLSLLLPLLMVVLPVTVLAGSQHEQVQGDTLHIHFISASTEYKSEPSLHRLGEFLEERYDDVRITASWGEDAGSDLPGIELLAEADLMVVFARRMTLPQEQLNYILDYVEQEKPVIGIRTASHAFQGFLELDERVFGGDYDGHGDDEPVEVTVADGRRGDPLLNGIEMPWRRPGKIYHNPELNPYTTILLYGEGLESGIYEPIAWSHRYGQEGRAFYTSMGLPGDFKNENFIRLILNAIEWTTGHELR